MWYKNQNGDGVKPEAVDAASSRKWAYVRKDFELVEAEEKDGQTVPEHWTWMEMKIPKEALEIYQQGTENTENVDMLTECVLEMSEILYAE